MFTWYPQSKIPRFTYMYVINFYIFIFRALAYSLLGYSPNTDKWNPSWCLTGIHSPVVTKKKHLDTTLNGLRIITL